MPDFTEILKIAVQEQDWKIICGLYKNITGEELPLPQPAEEEEPVEEDFLTKEYDLESLRENSSTEKVDSGEDDKYNQFTVPTRNSELSENRDSSGRQARPETVGTKSKLTNLVGVAENPFVDDGTESLINPETGKSFKEENKNIKITPRNKRSSLGMNDTSMIDVKCSECGESQKVSSVLSYGFSEIDSQNNWKCNDCSAKRAKKRRG